MLQTYISISHAQQWTWTIGEMDLQDLYWCIIEILDDKSDVWVRGALKWWNKQSNVAGCLMGKQVNNDDSEDDMAEIRARRNNDKTGAIEDQPHLQVEWEDQDGDITLIYNGLNKQTVTQRAPPKAMQQHHVADSCPQPKPTKGSTAIQGTSEKTTPQDQHELEDPEDA
ncbi:hypothetical protein L210DRAFT_3640087 [Boletus edulis BED1]|uniref:Uncharacterized protein n=1 Tax=Boletus edulis BED1 TaxID=1328754 RepID=A0AAD4C886_BOLED|nr:hypothetical protein L210DRAFT_3640087 [Boletus edulis BED1]